MVLTTRKTVARDNYAIYWQLRKQKADVRYIGVWSHAAFVPWDRAVTRRLLDEYPVVVGLHAPVWVEQRGVEYVSARFLSLWPDVVPNLPYIHQWEVVRLVHV